MVLNLLAFTFLRYYCKGLEVYFADGGIVHSMRVYNFVFLLKVKCLFPVLYVLRVLRSIALRVLLTIVCNDTVWVGIVNEAIYNPMLTF